MQSQTRQLAQIYHGSPQALFNFSRIQKLIADNPVTAFDPAELSLSRKDLFEKYLEKTREVLTLGGARMSEQDFSTSMGLFSQQLALGIHFKLFIHTLKNLCNQKQAEYFLKKALSLQMIGCYAQTQLGHGSDVQALQTTATYQSQHSQFIIHSPTISSTKWWVGQLGFLCTHAVVLAQLIIDGKRLGIHAFLVPIRNQEHKLLPGIRAGDIGPKYGFTNKDNGFVRFDKVRIPRQNMLMRFAKVNSKGEYTRQGDQRISYATMLITRAYLAKMSSICLGKAVTILVRYSHFRKQFKNEEGKDIRLVDYQLQRHKIYPHIAETYAYMFASQKLQKMLEKNLQNINQLNDFHMLNDCHAISCGLKALYSWNTFFAVEKLRRACGGHGFSSFSGLPSILKEYSPFPTYEGQNTVLMLQLGRYLLKCLQRSHKGKTVNENLHFLRQSNIVNIGSKKEFVSSQNLLRLLRDDAKIKIEKLAQRILSSTSRGKTLQNVWNSQVGLLAVRASTAFTNIFTASNFIIKTQSLPKGQVKTILEKVCLLYLVNVVFNTAIVSRQFSKECVDWLDQARLELLDQLAPFDNLIVDAFSFHQNTLASAFGWKDEKGYQRLLSWARHKNIMNSENESLEVRKALGREAGKMQFKATL